MRRWVWLDWSTVVRLARERPVWVRVGVPVAGVVLCIVLRSTPWPYAVTGLYLVEGYVWACREAASLPSPPRPSVRGTGGSA